MVSKLGKTLYLLVLLLIIGACVVGGYEALAAPGDQTPVTFPDAYLEAAIRKAINKPQGAIYASDLESLTKLHAMASSISNLTGLEHCTNLQELHLNLNRISDIAPLSSLNSLTSLALPTNQISDISALSGLTNLQYLDLNSNQISDISPLTGLSSLIRVNLYNNPLSVVSANIYIIQLGLKGVRVEGTSRTILPTIIIFTALVLVAMRMRRMANWGLTRRVLQLALIIIVSGLAYYLAAAVPLAAVALPVGIFASILVGFGTIVTFWSFRGWAWNLVAFALIVLWIVYLLWIWFSIHAEYFLLAGMALYSAPCLAAAGVFFLLRRVHLAIAIIVSVVVMFVGYVFAFVQNILVSGI